MKILYDYQAFFMQRFGGVSNSFVQLIKRLPKEIEYEIALRESDNGHLRASGLKKVNPCLQVEDNFIMTRKFKGQSFLYRQANCYFPLWTSLGRNRLCSIKALQKGDFDVFHPTFTNHYFLPYLNGKPFVLTIHDMIPELFFSKKDMQVREKPLLCRKAAHIIAVSEKTKQDLIDILHVPDKKVSVIYHGAPNYIDVSGELPIVKGKYILYVGQRNLYKNFDLMLNKITPVLNRHLELKIVCTGCPFTREELKLMNRLGIYDRMIHLHPSDRELVNLYANALCFVYPSAYEGFGIPILEAYQAQCPVLLNHKSCFPEIAKDAAIYFTMNEERSDLAEVMELFLNMSDQERKDMIEKQNVRLKNFSWENSAKKLAEIYQNVI